MFLTAALRSLLSVCYVKKSENSQNPEYYYNVRAPWNTGPEVEVAKRFLRDILAKVHDNQSFPAPTEEAIQPFSLYVTLKDDGTGRFGRFHELRVFDARGEYTQEEDDEHLYWQYLRQVEVIMLILDADPQKGQKYTRLITNLINSIHNTRQSLAVVITKVDKQNPHRYLEINGEVLLEQIIGDLNVRQLFSTFPTHEVFLTSAVGWCVDPDDAQKIIPNISDSSSKPQILRGGNFWRPYNAAYALAWAMDALEASRLNRLSDKRRASLIRKHRKRNVEIVEEYHERNKPNLDDRLHYMP